jgi:hypothetical protein
LSLTAWRCSYRLAEATQHPGMAHYRDNYQRLGQKVAGQR